MKSEQASVVYLSPQASQTLHWPTFYLGRVLTVEMEGERLKYDGNFDSVMFNVSYTAFSSCALC